MLVSIIVPCYNQGIFLTETLRSVLEQTHDQWECIIINDGSTDNTGNIAANFLNNDSRFVYVNTKNKGLSSARNTGIRLAKGEYVQLLDSDDLIAPDKLRVQVDFFERNQNVDICYTGSRYFKSDMPGRRLILAGRSGFYPHIEMTLYDKEEYMNVLTSRNPFVVSAPLHRKKIFEIVGLFDESFDAYEDWDFHYRCGASGLNFHYMGYSPETATLIRLHESSMSKNGLRMLRARQKLVAKHSIDFKGYAGDVNAGRLKILVSLLLPPFIYLWIKRFIRRW